jgi:hypothetical protein
MFPESTEFDSLQRETDFLKVSFCVVTRKAAELENGSGGALIVVALVERAVSMNS